MEGILTAISNYIVKRPSRELSVNTFYDASSQERGFGSNHLVFLKARPQHAMGRWESRILGYTRYNTRDI